MASGSEFQESKSETIDSLVVSFEGEDKDSIPCVFSSEAQLQKETKSGTSCEILSSEKEAQDSGELSNGVILPPEDEIQTSETTDASHEPISSPEGGNSKVLRISQAPIASIRSSGDEAQKIKEGEASHEIFLTSESKVTETTNEITSEFSLCHGNGSQEAQKDISSDMFALHPGSNVADLETDAQEEVILSPKYESRETKEEIQDAAAKTDSRWKSENPYQTINKPPRPLTIYCEIEEHENSSENVKMSTDALSVSQQEFEPDLNQRTSSEYLRAKSTSPYESSEVLLNNSINKQSNNAVPILTTDAYGTDVTADPSCQRDHFGKNNSETTICSNKKLIIEFKNTEQGEFMTESISEANLNKEVTKEGSSMHSNPSYLKDKKQDGTVVIGETESESQPSKRNKFGTTNSPMACPPGDLAESDVRKKLILGASDIADEANTDSSGLESHHSAKVEEVLHITDGGAAARLDHDLKRENKASKCRLSGEVSETVRIINMKKSDEELRVEVRENSEAKNSSNSAEIELQNFTTDKMAERRDGEVSAMAKDKGEDCNESGDILDENEKCKNDVRKNEETQNINGAEIGDNEGTSLMSKSSTSPSKHGVDEFGRPIRKSLGSVARTSSLKQKAYDKFTNKREEGTKDKSETSDPKSESRKLSRVESFSASAKKILHRKKSDVRMGEDSDEVDMKDKAHGLLYMRKKRLFSPWRKHFFVLDGSQLTYYRSRQHYSSLTGCQGAVDLTLLHDVIRKKPSTVFRTYYPLLLERRSLSPILLAADCEVEQQRWLDLLQRALGARKAASRKFSAKASTSKSSPDVSASTLPSSSKKKRKNSLRRSLSFRGRSKDKGKDEVVPSESEEETDDTKNESKPGSEILDKNQRESISDDERTELVKPKKILKTGVLLPAGEINSVRLKKVKIADNNNKNLSINNTEENEKVCPEQTFGVQLKKTSYKEKYLSENTKNITEESGNKIGEEHDFRSLLRSRRTSTTGVDKKLYVRYGKEPVDTLENGEKSPRKRSPSPSLPLSKSLQGVLNRSTETEDLVLDGTMEPHAFGGNEEAIKAAKSTEVINLISGRTCSVNHASRDKIRYSDPPSELDIVDEKFKAHPKLELKFSEERRESSLLETIESMDDSSIIKEGNNGVETFNTECIKRSKEVDTSSNSDGARENKVSSVTNITLTPVSKDSPRLSCFNSQQKHGSANKESDLDFSIHESLVENDKPSDARIHAPASSIKVSYNERKSEKTGEYRSELSSKIQNKDEVENKFEPDKASKEENPIETPETKLRENFAGEHGKSLKAAEESLTDIHHTNEIEAKWETCMNKSLKENSSLTDQKRLSGNDKEGEECAVLRNNTSSFIFRSSSRTSEPASFGDQSPNTSLDSRRTSAAEYSTTDRPDYTPQISVARSSSAESGEPLVRTSFMGNRFSWGSGANCGGTQNSSSDTNTSKESVGSSTTDLSRRHSYGNDLTVPDVPYVTRAKTPAYISDSSPSSSMSSVIRKPPPRKRQERPTSSSNRESLILPEYVVVEEDVGDSSSFVVSGSENQSDVPDEEK